MAWIQANWGLLVAVLFGISETLALIPAIQSNSIFQMVYNVIKSLAGKSDPKV